ncbi:hypothetical protein [Rhodanobacter lindaniclasticus]
MSPYSGTFEWQQFPEGRARFSGGIRGWDERRYETFAVEVDGDVTYGEIARAFLPNEDDFNIQVVSFGYGMRENVGILSDGSPGPHAQGSFPQAYLRRVQQLVVQLVRAGLDLSDRPSVLVEYSNAHFQGKVIFSEGWAVGAAAAESSV